MTVRKSVLLMMKPTADTPPLPRLLPPAQGARPAVSPALPASQTSPSDAVSIGAPLPAQSSSAALPAVEASGGRAFLLFTSLRAMREAGVDISSHTSKRPSDIGVTFDLVVTVCGHADEHCPSFPGARVVHAGFDDPPKLAAKAMSDDDAMPHYRRVREEIRLFVAGIDSILPKRETR